MRLRFFLLPAAPAPAAPALALPGAPGRFLLSEEATGLPPFFRKESFGNSILPSTVKPFNWSPRPAMVSTGASSEPPTAGVSGVGGATGACGAAGAAGFSATGALGASTAGAGVGVGAGAGVAGLAGSAFG